VLELPSERPLAGTERPDVPYFLVGDEGFALNRNTLRPFRGYNLSVNNNVYKYRLCRLWSYVECAFGILSSKWRIFQRPLNVNPGFAVDIVKTCVFLHNFVRERDGCKSSKLWQWLVLKLYLMEISTCGVNSEQCKEKRSWLFSNRWWSLIPANVKNTNNKVHKNLRR
jgi:hypothetical protein